MEQVPPHHVAAGGARRGVIGLALGMALGVVLRWLTQRVPAREVEPAGGSVDR